MADKSPLSTAGWPYNPFKRSDRTGSGKRNGGGKTMQKRPVWWEKGTGGMRADDPTKHVNLVKGSAPRGRKQRNGG